MERAWVNWQAYYDERFQLRPVPLTQATKRVQRALAPEAEKLVPDVVDRILNNAFDRPLLESTDAAFRSSNLLDYDAFHRRMLAVQQYFFARSISIRQRIVFDSEFRKRPLASECLLYFVFTGDVENVIYLLMPEPLRTLFNSCPLEPDDPTLDRVQYRPRRQCMRYLDWKPSLQKTFLNKPFYWLELAQSLLAHQHQDASAPDYEAFHQTLPELRKYMSDVTMTPNDPESWGFKDLCLLLGLPGDWYKQVLTDDFFDDVVVTARMLAAVSTEMEYALGMCLANREALLRILTPYQWSPSDSLPFYLGLFFRQDVQPIPFDVSSVTHDFRFLSAFGGAYVRWLPNDERMLPALLRNFTRLTTSDFKLRLDQTYPIKPMALKVILRLSSSAVRDNTVGRALEYFDGDPMPIVEATARESNSWIVRMLTVNTIKTSNLLFTRSGIVHRAVANAVGSPAAERFLTAWYGESRPSLLPISGPRVAFRVRPVMPPPYPNDIYSFEARRYEENPDFDTALLQTPERVPDLDPSVFLPATDDLFDENPLCIAFRTTALFDYVAQRWVQTVDLRPHGIWSLVRHVDFIRSERAVIRHFIDLLLQSQTDNAAVALKHIMIGEPDHGLVFVEEFINVCVGHRVQFTLRQNFIIFATSARLSPAQCHAAVSIFTAVYNLCLNDEEPGQPWRPVMLRLIECMFEQHRNYVWSPTVTFYLLLESSFCEPVDTLNLDLMRSLLRYLLPYQRRCYNLLRRDAAYNALLRQ